MERTSIRRVLGDYVAAYVDEIDTLDYGDLRSAQVAPYASLARGAAGIPYLLWRLGRPRQASEWLGALLADRRPLAYRFGGFEPAPSSYMYGRSGLYWLAGLIGDRRGQRAITAYVRLARASKPRNDFMEGAAGHLTGARLLLGVIGNHRELRAVADELADVLLARLRVRARRPWRGADAYGFAYGWPGLLHAVLGWKQLVGQPIEPWLAQALRRLAEGAAARPPDPRFTASWCNGAAGTTLLWARAFEVTGDELFLDSARAAANTALAVDERRSYLCCGAGGIAYALGALARVDPEKGWLERATEVAARAVEVTAMTWPNGLYLGHPGLVCLAFDLVGERSCGFPAIES